MYAIIDNLTGNKKKALLPEGFSDEELATMFYDFFENKIENLIVGFADEALFDLQPVVNQQNKLTSFNTVTLSNIRSTVGRVK